jgi:hypothetical protein
MKVAAFVEAVSLLPPAALCPRAAAAVQRIQQVKKDQHGHLSLAAGV